MNQTEVSFALDEINKMPGAPGVLHRMRDSSGMADLSWDRELLMGRVTPNGLAAARAAAMELSLIADGALHVLSRAPAGCQSFGILSRKEPA